MDSHATLNHAISYASAGNTKKAVRLVKEILSCDSQNDRAWILLADLTNDPAVAVKSLEKALQINPKNQQVCNKLSGYVSTAKCREVLGISHEEFQTFLGVEEVPAANGFYPGRHALRKKTRPARINLSLLMGLMVVAGFLYLVRPDIHWTLGGEQAQVASAQGSGKIYRAPAVSLVNAPVAAPGVAVTGSTNEPASLREAALPVSHTAQPVQFVTLMQKLEESGPRPLIHLNH